MITPEEAVQVGLRIQGWKTVEELVWLARHAAKSNLVIDVGCWRGRTTKIMSAVCPGVVIAVDHLRSPYTGETARNEIVKKSPDLEIYSSFLSNLRDEMRALKVVCVHADGDDVYQPVEQFLNGRKVDMAWIDGDHDYADVKRDILKYGAMVRPGGILCGHDYEPAFPGVVRAVEECCPGFQRGPGTSWWLTK
jgi:SAM-dependent methyltransferase